MQKSTTSALEDDVALGIFK